MRLIRGGRLVTAKYNDAVTQWPDRPARVRGGDLARLHAADA
jgi:hypothetical protein